MEKYFNVVVKANSRVIKVEELDDVLKVSVKAQPIEGKANKEVLSVLKQYFKQRGYKIQKIFIVKGTHFKNKLIKIEYM